MLSVSWTDATMAGALALMGFVVSKGGFGYLEWGLFGLLAAGGIVMAFFDQMQYGKIPLFSAVINAVMLAAWGFQDPQSFAIILSLFAALYVVSGYMLQSRSRNPLQWAGLSAAAGIGYYLLAYFKLHHKIVPDIPFFWGLLALTMAALSIKALAQVVRSVPENHAQKQHLLAMFAGTATAFLSIGLCIEMDREFLSVAFAGEILALSWINTRVNIHALRKIIAAVAAVFVFLLFPQILLLAHLTVNSILGLKFHVRNGISIVDWPLFHLGIPALLLLGASHFLRRQKDGRLVKIFEITAISLAAVTGYYLMRQLMHPDQNIMFIKASFIERGIITNMFFAYGLACLLLGSRYARSAVSLCGLAFSVIAAFRVGYFDLFIYNPLWVRQDVGMLPVLNALLLTYGAPVFWLSQIIRHLPQLGKTAWDKYGYASMLLLSFALLSFEVRQVFHGAFLNDRGATNAEIYAYSIVWLLFGISLLFLGTLRKDKMIRMASLAVMVLTVGKVFLYDASELTGLFRVFSFAGLGLSLLGLSWFYTRFVFRSREGG